MIQQTEYPIQSLYIAYIEANANSSKVCNAHIYLTIIVYESYDRILQNLSNHWLEILLDIIISKRNQYKQLFFKTTNEATLSQLQPTLLKEEFYYKNELRATVSCFGPYSPLLLNDYSISIETLFTVLCIMFYKIYLYYTNIQYKELLIAIK